MSDPLWLWTVPKVYQHAGVDTLARRASEGLRFSLQFKSSPSLARRASVAKLLERAITLQSETLQPESRFFRTARVSLRNVPDARFDKVHYDRVVQQALDYLRLHGQADNGGFSPRLGPGVTAVVLTGVLQTGRVSPLEPWVARGLNHLESFIKPNGAIYHLRYDNYVTSVALMAFHAANRDGRYSEVISRAQNHLRRIQWDQGEQVAQDDPFFGGFGYGTQKRPDLSNTQFSVEALAVSGIGPDDPSLIKALQFLSRCQNLPSEQNQLGFARKVSGDDRGGFIYSPIGDGESKAGKTPEGALRSYGSMTYAGLKSMIYAGADRNDPRVKAAVAWLRKHWSVKDNPGMGQLGVYYYFHTMAKALNTLGEDPFVDDHRTRHNWRLELFRELARRQRPDGSWVNPADRWYEGDPNLVTGYALMALSYLKPPAGN